MAERLRDSRRRTVTGWLAWVACALVLVAALPSAALAGEASKRDRRGDVKAKRLTAKERRALDIVSVRATGDESLGLFVTVRFRGNIERALGRRRLKRGLVALVLRPKKSSRRGPAGLTTRGPGIVGKTRRRTRSTDVGVARDGRELTFFIAGPGLSRIRRIEVKAFATRPSASRRASGAVTKLERAREWDRIVDRSAADAAFLTATKLDDSASCAELKFVRLKTEDKIVELRENDESLRELLDSIKRASQNLDNDELLLRLGSAINRLLGSEVTFENLQRDLALARRLTEANIKRNREALDSLLRFLGKLDALIAAKCGPGQTLGATFGWQNFGPGEVKGIGRFFLGGGSGARASQSTSPITAVRVVIPPSDGTQRQITNQLCPSQLPNAQASGSTLTCSGGQLSLNQEFSLNVRTSPAPTSGMGGELFGQQGGAFKGPFAISGP